MFGRLDLAGKRVLLTGASSGIGRALALRLAEARARLALASRGRERLEELAAAVRQRGQEALVVPADVTAAEERRGLIEATVRALGGLDILINNAGVGAMGFFDEAGEDRLRRIFDVNFFGTTELTRLALPHLRRGNQPTIVNIASVLGRRAIPGCTEYCASKFAVVGWSEGLRAELAPEGIHVLVVCPGSIQTAFRENLLEDRLNLPYRRRPRMPADVCARQIVRAMWQRRNEAVITGPAKVLVWVDREVPWLLDALLARYARKAEKKETDPSRPRVGGEGLG